MKFTWNNLHELFRKTYSRHSVSGIDMLYLSGILWVEENCQLCNRDSSHNKHTCVKWDVILTKSLWSLFYIFSWNGQPGVATRGDTREVQENNLNYAYRSIRGKALLTFSRGYLCDFFPRKLTLINSEVILSEVL